RSLVRNAAPENTFGAAFLFLLRQSQQIALHHFVVLIGLNHKRGSEFAKFALCGDGYLVATHHSFQPSTSVKVSSMNCCSDGSAESDSATMRHSCSKSGRRVSGTQIFTGRNPA